MKLIKPRINVNNTDNQQVQWGIRTTFLGTAMLIFAFRVTKTES